MSAAHLLGEGEVDAGGRQEGGACAFCRTHFLHVQRHVRDGAVRVPVLVQILHLARGAQEAVLLQLPAPLRPERARVREDHPGGKSAYRYL
eukprot:CAMPEP_0198686954 /NCGR_PEP_ID=MMETSP1468-20131203/34174_1 /TAXON_ID=1461545 /ORGANISM="Mantoniella sp, Strain CCMP1436" /LENGTH=90 /DNA_ID=CAMNT_0044433869 /DNA_START=425 /DNA_END=698 /DNA_ORIENTATION=+